MGSLRLPAAPTRADDETDLEILALLDEGFTAEEVAEALELSEADVARRARAIWRAMNHADRVLH